MTLQFFVDYEMLGGVMRAGITAIAFSRLSGSSGRPEPGDLGKEGR
jgi:hypothetical protein